MRHAALARVQGDRLDFSAGAAGGDGVSEFMKGDDEHFEGPEGPAHVGEVPEKRDDDDVGNDDAERYPLGAVYAEAAAEEVVIVGGGEGSEVVGMGKERGV